MVKANASQQNANALQRQTDKESAYVDALPKWPTRLTVGILSAVAIGGVCAILWASTAFADIAVAVNFVVVNILSLFVLLAVITQACIYYGQRNLMEKQTALMRISERAYVGVQKARLRPWGIGKCLTVLVTLLNGGRTPAWNVRIAAQMAVGIVPPDTPELSPEDEPNFLPAGIPQKVMCQYPIPLTDAMLQELEAGNVSLFLSLEIWFDDYWGVPQHRPFRVVYNWSDKMFQGYRDAEY